MTDAIHKRQSSSVLLSGGNAFYSQLAEVVGEDSLWVELRRQAFGLTHAGQADRGSPALVDQIKAGLQLYVATAELLDDALLSQDKPLVQETVELIIEVIGLPSSG